MMFSSPHLAFIEHLVSRHSLSRDQLSQLVSPQLISPFEITLPKAALEQAQSFVKAAYRLKESIPYQDFLKPEIEARGLKDPGNKGIAMSYDFHWSEEQQLKLIEVNTNASFLALGFELYQCFGKALPVTGFSMDEVHQNLKTEMQLQGKELKAGAKISIIDEEPEKQRLFSEFLVYQKYFQEWGYACEIHDYRQLSQKADFVYNRLTDFFFDFSDSKILKEKFLNREICFSPSPFEYLMLADKQRMIDWSQEPWRNSIPQQNLSQSKTLTIENAEALWSERKKLFFKPKRAFGAKQSYKGASISRRAFDEITNQDFIAQEFCPAPELTFETAQGPQKFKYDLRFYAYQDRVQLAVARLYQGQVTNLKTPYGGFATIKFA